MIEGMLDLEDRFDLMISELYVIHEALCNKDCHPNGNDVSNALGASIARLEQWYSDLDTLVRR